MTICIAGICKVNGKKAVVLCGDYQGTKGDYLKADDTYKIWHFHGGKGAICFAGDVDAGREFFRRFTTVTREFAAIKKTRGDGDMDLRLGEYVAKIRDLVRQVIRERAEHVVGTRYATTLETFYAPDAPSRFSPHRYDEIFQAIKSADLGAEFLVAYLGDEEPVFIRIEQNGHVLIEDGNYVAIGSGEPLASAILCQIEGDTTQTLPQCLTWIYQAKVAAERNPYVGDMTAFWVLLADGDEFLISDRAWEILQRSVSKSTLVAVSEDLEKLSPKDIVAKYRPE